jgi:CubicO group peptidase (beta-lactamase class C family)
MRLVEQGKIDLDADIHNYITDYPDRSAVITIRELGGHLAGIRAYRGNEFLSNEHYGSLRAGLNLFQNDPLLFKPGEKFSYSSYGFNLIGAAMESAAHEKFVDYMQQAVFTPLQMSNTIPDETLNEPSAYARFYVLDTSKTNFVLAPPVDNRYKLPSAGYLSTPEDLVRFGMAMLQPGFLKRASLDTMFTSQKTANGQRTGYGIGWYIDRDAHGKGRRVWFHDGGAVGGSAWLILYPDNRMVIAMSFNYEHAVENTGNSIRLIADAFAVPSK